MRSQEDVARVPEDERSAECEPEEGEGAGGVGPGFGWGGGGGFGGARCCCCCCGGLWSGGFGGTFGRFAAGAGGDHFGGGGFDATEGKVSGV